MRSSDRLKARTPCKGIASGIRMAARTHASLREWTCAHVTYRSQPPGNGQGGILCVMRTAAEIAFTLRRRECSRMYFWMMDGKSAIPYFRSRVIWHCIKMGTYQEMQGLRRCRTTLNRAIFHSECMRGLETICTLGSANYRPSIYFTCSGARSGVRDTQGQEGTGSRRILTL
ncbi:hypothetical protein PYCCODRAFT_1251524 [Trametes coccinea BRFM310]|uniref:Uncharacterized protein n=1 Tax=Trametes coccinea (strain BRFM310) TaxID=1353009 RepID=A0A1Y2I8W1_TRAC3|nr:hypothetical protein PYCCODRAFT_1251524 [Trametes coccinea BRFM310]